MKGIIKNVIEDKGFCFILSHEDNREYFCHHSALMNGSLSKQLSGHTVEFEPTTTPKGCRAENVYLD